MPESERGHGVATEMLAKQVETFERLGIQRLELDAAFEGRAAWPKLGFLPEPATEARIVADYNQLYGANAKTIAEVTYASGGSDYLRALGEDVPMSTDVGSLRSRLSRSSSGGSDGSR